MQRSEFLIDILDLFFLWVGFWFVHRRKNNLNYYHILIRGRSMGLIDGGRNKLRKKEKTIIRGGVGDI